MYKGTANSIELVQFLVWPLKKYLNIQYFKNFNTDFEYRLHGLPFSCEASKCKRNDFQVKNSKALIVKIQNCLADKYPKLIPKYVTVATQCRLRTVESSILFFVIEDV